MESLLGFVSLWSWVTVDGSLKSIGGTAQGIIHFEIYLDWDFNSNNVFVSILVMMKYEVVEGIFENSFMFSSLFGFFPYFILFYYFIYFLSYG